MSRQSIKESLKSVLVGVAGVKSVFTYLPRTQQGMQFPSVIITLEKTHEKRASMGNPGRRRIHYTAGVYIQHIDPNPSEETAQTAFDNLLDAVDDALRANKDLGGTVLKSAWDYIDTDVFEPQLAGQGISILLRAVKTFEVEVEILA